MQDAGWMQGSGVLCGKVVGFRVRGLGPRVVCAGVTGRISASTVSCMRPPAARCSVDPARGND
jgi:hypothetical protein